jgi:quercetin dioxygenase-like cupin family protein
MKAFTLYRIKDAESIDTPEGVVTPLFINEQLMIVKLSLPPNLTIPPHSHNCNIVAMVTKGRLEVMHGNERVVLEEGDMFFALPNVVLGFSNPSQGTTEILSVSYPPSYKSVEEFKEVLRSFARRG